MPRTWERFDIFSSDPGYFAVGCFGKRRGRKVHALTHSPFFNGAEVPFCRDGYGKTPRDVIREREMAAAALHITCPKCQWRALRAIARAARA